MNEREEPSALIRIFGPIVFFVGALAAILWFVKTLFTLMAQLYTHSAVIFLDKGALYLLGTGMGLGLSAFVTAYEFWRRKPLTNHLAGICTKLVYVSLVLLFATPHVTSYLTGHYLHDRKYVMCEEASSQWLFVVRSVYANPASRCPETTRQ